MKRSLGMEDMVSTKRLYLIVFFIFLNIEHTLSWAEEGKENVLLIMHKEAKKGSSIRKKDQKWARSAAFLLKEGEINFYELGRARDSDINMILSLKHRGLIEDVHKVYQHSLSAFYVTVAAEKLEELSQYSDRVSVQRNIRIHRPQAVKSFGHLLYKEEKEEGEIHELLLNIDDERFDLPYKIRTWGSKFIGLPKDDGQRFNQAHAYIVDGFVDRQHQALNVVEVMDFVSSKDDPTEEQDPLCYDHATHVAGIIGASFDEAGKGINGVVPGASIHSIRVFDCHGETSLIDVLTGLEYIAEHLQFPAVVNLSLGGITGDFPELFTLAVQNLSNKGAFLAFSAGNENDSACNYINGYLGQYPGVVSVGSVNRFGLPSEFSNYGLCVSLWAPGEDILSSKYGGQFGYFSGTSMACPFVAGSALLYMATHKDMERNPMATKKYLEYQSSFSFFRDTSHGSIRLLNIAPLFEEQDAVK